MCVYIYMYMREGNGIPLQYSCLENPVDGHLHTPGVSSLTVEGGTRRHREATRIIWDPTASKRTQDSNPGLIAKSKQT